MEETSKQIEVKEPAPRVGSGALLSAARKEQKRSIEEIADELNLSLTQIRTIELDQSEGLPEPTYVRGYIRAYANLLGLNPEEILDHYLNRNWQKSANLDDMPRGIGDAESTETSSFSPARVVVFLGLAGIIGFFWYSGGLDLLLSQSTSKPESSAVVAEATSTDNTDAVIGDTSLGNDLDTFLESQTIDSEPSNDGGAQLSAGSGAVPDTIAETAPTLASTTNETKITLSFNETSWVDIRDEKQNRLAYQSYAAGDKADVSAEGVLSILIGNAKGVKMNLNNKPYDLVQHTEGVYAKFSVGTPSVAPE